MDKNMVVFVTGANRGIGLEFVRQFRKRGYTVIAGYRDPERSSELLGMIEKDDGLTGFVVDVVKPGQLESLRDHISEEIGHLDMLVNNAAINIKYSGSIREVEESDLMESFHVNVVGPFLAANTLHPLLKKSKFPVIINISSAMGSIANADGNAIPYRISKAAVNMLTKSQAINYKDDGIIVAALHPGWVRTDMGGDQATLSTRESVTGMLEVIDGLDKSDIGVFMGYDGNPRSY